MFEGMSIFFDRKMNVILAQNEIFSKHATNCRGASLLLICKKNPCTCYDLVAIPIFVRVVKDAPRTAKLVSSGWKGAIDLLNNVKLDYFRVLQQPVRI